MKKTFIKLISVFLAVTLTFSIALSGVSAANQTASEAVKVLEKDIPIVEIPGFGETIYKGLSTETEVDDMDIWGISTDEITGLVKKHILGLLTGLLTGNFEKLDLIFTDVLTAIFGDAACDENGVPNPDTGIKVGDNVYPKNEYGYANSYSFHYDWRLDMHTISSQLHEYINRVLEVTGAEKVGLVCFSMGGCVTMTYLYEHYYLATPEEREKIHSAVFISGAMNGVSCCEDPFSGNITLDSTSLMRMLQEMLGSTENMKPLYNLLDLMYSFRMFEPLVNFSNNYIVGNLSSMVDNALPASIGSIPGFYAMMSSDRYYEAENFNFNTEEEKVKYAGLIEKNRYFHDNVQANSDNILTSLIEDGKNLAIISEYGYSIIPVTSDNNRMCDGTIGTYETSFGATCADVDRTLGENYVQAVTCSCGGNHISPDNQIDASTCKYPDITWFAKNVRHSCANRYFETLVDLATYSDEQINVWTYPDLPQFMINQLDLRLVPMNAANAGKVVPFNETTILGKFFSDLF